MIEEMITIPIRKTEKSRRADADFDNLVFGRTFSDHMFSIDYADGEWHNPRIEPFGNIEVTPGLNAFHYGQCIFEGMKAFYVDENTVNIFRPQDHHARFNISAARMCMPSIDYDVFISALEELVRLDHQWVPKKPGTALYLRPFMIPTDDWINSIPAETYRFMIITSPVAAYYKEGINPVKLTTPGDFARSFPGGTGYAKAAGNYAASFLPAKQARDRGYTQVLWLDAKEHKYIEEVGSMNILFLMNDTLVTPALEGGTILSGITRRSVLALAESWGVKVEERPVSIDELFEAKEQGTLQEVFGSGTAAVISPVGLIEHEGKVLEIGDGNIGPFAQKVYDSITGIQYGKLDDPFEWMCTIKLG